MLLAIDPGSKSSGWCLLERYGTRVRYFAHGTAPSTPHGLRELVDDALGRYGHVEIALEVVEGFAFDHFRGKALIATARAVGIVEGLAVRGDLDVVPLTAAVVRKALVGRVRAHTGGKGSKSGTLDGVIADAVRANVLGWPERSNVHARDAAALGIVANWTLTAAASGKVAS